MPGLDVEGVLKAELFGVKETHCEQGRRSTSGKLGINCSRNCFLIDKSLFLSKFNGYTSKTEAVLEESAGQQDRVSHGEAVHWAPTQSWSQSGTKGPDALFCRVDPKPLESCSTAWSQHSAVDIPKPHLQADEHPRPVYSPSSLAASPRWHQQPSGRGSRD